MRKIKWSGGVLIVAISLVVFAACGQQNSGSNTGSSDDSSAEEGQSAKTVYEWDWPKSCAIDNPAAIMSIEFAEEVKEKTDGQLVITVRASGELPFKQNEYVTACGNGSFAMADAVLSSISQDLKSGAITGLPYLIDNYDELALTVDTLKSKIDQELSIYGITMVGYYNYPHQQVWGQGTAPEKFSDLKGLKIRTQGIEQGEALELDGAIPTSIDNAEVATSVSRGIINGAVTAGITMISNTYYEIMNWGYLVDLQALPVYIVVNDAALASLPEDVRTTFLRLADEYSAKCAPRMEEYEIAAQERLVEEFGLTINRPTEEDKVAKQAQAKEYWKNWIIISQ
jgi:TRAP-type C4-dicarboxylate transport system substrate-binding protein